MPHAESLYLNTDPLTTTDTLDVAEVPTAVVVFEDYPLSEMSLAFDSAFQVLRRVLRQVGVQTSGPSFSLHHRLPTDTATFELGVPVDKPLDQEIATSNGLTVKASTLPGGRVARISHIGSYDELGEVWGTFMQAITDSDKDPAFPFWEVYITQPSPDVDPAEMRTDLYTRLT